MRHQTARNSLVVALVALSGCDRSAPAPTAVDAHDRALDGATLDASSPDAAPDLSQDMPAARAVAARVASYLRQLGDHAYTSAGGEQYTTQSARAAFTANYGARLAEASNGTGFVLGQRFALTTAGAVSFQTLTTDDGRPVILVWGNGSKTLFFYQPAIVDPRDGSIYQGVVAAGTRTWPVSTAAKVDLFGPNAPPADARLTGNFSLQQVQTLSQVIQQLL